MRPGQKNRMRGGRSNNSNNSGSRRGPNPLTRSYESNGPDVKVRGTPQHIAEKYVQLARDAHTASDTVMAEGYLQHAEHYYRIIAAAQNAQQAAYNQANGFPNPVSDDAIDDEDEFEVAGADRFTFRAPQSFQQPQNGYQPAGQSQPYNDVAGTGEQPIMEGQSMESPQPTYQPRPPRQERPLGNRRPFEGDRPERADRQERPERSDRQDRPERGNRRFGRDRPFGERQAGERSNGEVRPTEPGAYSESAAQGSTDFAADELGLPSFITAPVRVIITDDSAPAPSVPDTLAGDTSETDGRLRPRRRRRPKVDGASGTGEADQD